MKWLLCRFFCHEVRRALSFFWLEALLNFASGASLDSWFFNLSSFLLLLKIR